MIYKRLFPILIFLAVTVLMTAAARADGNGSLRLGYTLLDEEGNLGVNYETYNLYEGPSLSLDNFRYWSENGLNLSADLKNLTLNNRDLNAALYKPGLFAVSLNNHQYRRIYSFDGDKFTRRRSTGGQGHFYPVRNIKIFAGYNQSDKHGESQYPTRPYGDIIPAATDYTRTSFHAGAQAMYRGGNLRLEYRRHDFTDNTASADDREAETFSANIFMPVPKYEKLVVSGGYRHRQDLHEKSTIEMVTNQGWAAAKIYLPRNFTAEYRFMAARTDHDREEVEIDNYVNTATVGKSWPSHGGLRVGYENRVKDEILKRTTSSGFLFSGWFKYQNRLLLRARITTREKEVTEGATLLGDEGFTRHRISGRYTFAEWGNLALIYQGKFRTSDDIDARVDYNALTARVDLDREAWGRLELSYSYYTGEYDHRSGSEYSNFEFGDHVVTGTVYPVAYRKLQLSGGVSYFRSRQDLDTEKIGGHIGAAYPFYENYLVEARYSVFNYDDFHVIDEYYTGNIVEIYLIKNFSL